MAADRRSRGTIALCASLRIVFTLTTHSIVPEYSKSNHGSRVSIDIIESNIKLRHNHTIMRSAMDRIGRLPVSASCASRIFNPPACNQLTSFDRSTFQNLNRPQNARTMVSRRMLATTRLAEVGKFEEKLTGENCYPAGQPFLHRIFGYRGVTLFPWLARVHDIDLRKQYCDTSGTLSSRESHYHERHEGNHESQSIESEENYMNQNGNNGAENHVGSNKTDTSSKRKSTFRSVNKQNQEQQQTTKTTYKFTNPNATKFHPYYQVLIDTRDCPFVSSRTQTEAVTFLGHPDNSKLVFPIKGLDYVAHDDILPYTSFEEQPIRHELHRKLFRCEPNAGETINKYVPSDLLDSWRNKHPWIELSRVYKETTENVRVTVIPFYLGHTTIEDTTFHWWRYCVRLENLSDISVQLCERHWKIFSQTNMLQTIKGRGVVGVEPLLTKREPAYQYSSHVNLQDKNGHMWGTFKMQREDGNTFECRIPPFSLESSLDSSQPTRFE